MIPTEKASEFLSTKKSPLITKKQLVQFSEKYQTLGLMITVLDKKYLNNYYKKGESVPDFKKHFGKNPSVNPWITSEGKKLSLLLFGKFQSEYIAKVWELLETLPYQKGWGRRSFRAKPNDTYIENKIFYFQHIYKEGRSCGANLTLFELAEYDVYFYTYTNCYFFAVALANKKIGHQLHEKIKDILFGENEIGGVSRNLIKGLLISNEPENWKIVKHLLLAAQRQEGLRQTILEVLDETSIGAIEYFIKVILHENLFRFSSVVRAIDTWFGFAWDAPKKSTIKRVLNLAISFFENKDLVGNALKSKDNLEVYVALWFLGLTDVDVANMHAISIVETGVKEKKILALMFMAETGRSNNRITKWINAELGNDLESDFWALQVRPKGMKTNQQIFDQLKIYGDTIPRNGKKFEGKVFSWSSYHIHASFFYRIMIEDATNEQIKLLAEDISQIPNDIRFDFINKVFPNYFENRYSSKIKSNPPKLDLKKEPWKRTALYQIIQDRSIGIVQNGLALLTLVDLEKSDFDFMITMLARKNKDLREDLIQLILKQEDQNISSIVSSLLASSKVDQRLAGLEILTILNQEKRLSTFVEKEVSTYQERNKFTKNENVFLEKFTENSSRFSIKNGFGIINYNDLTPFITPVEKFKPKKAKSSKEKSSNKLPDNFLFPQFFNLKKMATAINQLVEIIEKNKHFEYEIIGENNTTNTVLLANTIALTHHEAYQKKPVEQLEFLPLGDLWKNWYNNSKLNDYEMLAAIHNCGNYTRALTHISSLKEFHQQYIPVLSNLNLDPRGYWNSINRKVESILSFLFLAYVDFSKIFSFNLDIIEDMIIKIPKKIEPNKNDSFYYYETQKRSWFDLIPILSFNRSVFSNQSKMKNLDPKLLLRYWKLQMYLIACKATSAKLPNTFKLEDTASKILDHQEINSPDTWLSLKLFELKKISTTDLQFQYLLDPMIMQIMEGVKNYYTKDIKFEPELPLLFKDLKTNLLSIEMERGDIPTDASKYLGNLNTIKGTYYLVNLLERLGKENLTRGYSWVMHKSKRMSFSSLIKKCWPLDNETYEDFKNHVKGTPIIKKRWIEVAMYAPQWANWIGNFFKIKKLEDAVWWFHAHGSDYMTAEKETFISRYSNIEKMDFQDNAIDIEWFNDVYQSVGKQNWKLLHDAAKYISDANGHRQVKLYSSIMLGEIKIRETLTKIKLKRDKSYVRGLGLIPLSKTNVEKDLLNRYNLLQTFLKESKQFGAQRQQSEKNAVKIGMDNLARNAGYNDSIRFSWIMEGKATQKIMEKAKVKIENVVLQLIVDDHGTAHINIEKDGNPQKSIPAKLKKHKTIIELQKNKTFLRSQYKRTRISLENAMLQEDEFSSTELQNIMKHPVVKTMLEKLVLFNRTKASLGFWRKNQFIQLNGKVINNSPTDQFIIAHPFHLYQNKVWNTFQKYIFENQIIQPFKQIFRELYLVTKNEREKGTESNRYAGHQIQPKKTVALLRTQGWTVQYEEGLQKVHHKKNVIATMYAMADWFSPADVEAPTLEQIQFFDRKERKIIYLNKIDPIVFSEVMRDIDLVVSVAHVGGVDPEASHSTLEMRAVLAKESAKLFKLKNVTVKDRHIIIKGKLADYSIHLGSGIIKKDGLFLSIIPVHSQHRGRMFLPFIDDDPKSAEIISKMKLLAEDFKIKDPTILAQING